MITFARKMHCQNGETLMWRSQHPDGRSLQVPLEQTSRSGGGVGPGMIDDYCTSSGPDQYGWCARHVHCLVTVDESVDDTSSAFGGENDNAHSLDLDPYAAGSTSRWLTVCWRPWNENRLLHQIYATIPRRVLSSVESSRYIRPRGARH